MKIIASLSQAKSGPGLTYWHVSDKETVALTSGMMPYRSQVNLAKYPPEMAKIFQRDIFWFFLKDEDFMSRTISDGSVDLDKFPAVEYNNWPRNLKVQKLLWCI